MVWWFIDQVRVNELLHGKSIPVTLLEKQKFPNGMILSNLKDRNLNSTVAIHANWNERAL
jgi:hypothetical protein